MFLLLGLAPVLRAQDFPQLSGRVVDAANVIPQAEEAQLTLKLGELEQQSQRQLVIVTLPSLQGYDIADYGYRLGRHWGIGDEKRNDGALLIVAPNERKVRIEVGYGLEPVLTDGLSFLIIQNAILPRFKEGDLPGGIVAGADLIVQQLTLPDAEARQVAQQAEQSARQSDFEANWVSVIFVIILFAFFILPQFARARGGSRYRQSGLPVIVWGGGGGGGFGGGFSGGGGSFGGGGSSGSW